MNQHMRGNTWIGFRWSDDFVEEEKWIEPGPFFFCLVADGSALISIFIIASQWKLYLMQITLNCGL